MSRDRSRLCRDRPLFESRSPAICLRRESSFGASAKRHVRAIEDYTPNEDYGDLELDMKADDVLELTGDDAPEGWLHVKHQVERKRGKGQGLVPELRWSPSGCNHFCNQ